MTPFLARLAERAAPAPQGSAVARPIVAPLFAAGAMLEPDAAVDPHAEAGGAFERRGPASPPAAADTLTSPLSGVHPAPDGIQTAAPRAPVEGSSAALPGSAARPPTASDPRPEATRPTHAAARLPDMLDPSAARRAPEPRTHAAIEGVARAAPTRAEARAGPVVPAPRPAPPQSSQAGEPAPIVRVTIGRIEVRAVTVPAPATPRPPAEPAKRSGIVLEEYLRSGSSGP